MNQGDRIRLKAAVAGEIGGTGMFYLPIGTEGRFIGNTQSTIFPIFEFISSGLHKPDIKLTVVLNRESVRQSVEVIQPDEKK